MKNYETSSQESSHTFDSYDSDYEHFRNENIIIYESWTLLTYDPWALLDNQQLYPFKKELVKTRRLSLDSELCDIGNQIGKRLKLTDSF